VISVRDHEKYSFPVRVETGLSRMDYETIKTSKNHLLRDNYNFFEKLPKGNS